MSRHTLRFLSADDVRKALPMADAIAAMKEAFAQLSDNRAIVPVRMNMEIPQERGRALFMPAYLPGSRTVALKAVSIMDENPRLGLPLIHALLMVLNAKTGQPLALMDGEYLTAVRTGAASGLATDLLARQNAEVVMIFGAGAQARSQLEGVCAVRTPRRAYVLSRTSDRAHAFAAEMSTRLPIKIDVAKSTEEIANADIVCTATTSRSPLFVDDILKPGVHINAIGAYRPDMCEVPAGIVQQARVVVDHRESCLAEAGDLIQPLRAGVIDENYIYAELGEIVSGSKAGRQTDDEITLFKSVGNAVQDVAAASQVLENAEKLGLGTVVSL